jgi:antirestriction protein ArdC
VNIRGFRGENKKYKTLFHEPAHWADHNILGTELSGGKGSTEYAYHELVAELSACFLCRACQIPNDFEQVF